MEYETVKKECDKYGYKCIDFFGDIVIRTKFEQWKFEPTCGKTKLYHKGCSGKMQRHTKNDYHIEFNEWITPQNLLKYIYEHETAKFSKEKIKDGFSVNIKSKQNQYNKMKLRQLQSML